MTTPQRKRSDKPPLLQVTLHEGGAVIINKGRLARQLVAEKDYKALAAILDGVHELEGSLIELVIQARIRYGDEMPVMPQPGRMQ